MSITRLYKQAVYDANNARIGEIDDVLMTNDGRAMALVIGVGGFLGIGETHVLVPFNAVNVTERDGSVRLVMNTTRDELKGAKHYRYERSKYLWVPADSKISPVKTSPESRPICPNSHIYGVRVALKSPRLSSGGFSSTHAGQPSRPMRQFESWPSTLKS